MVDGNAGKGDKYRKTNQKKWDRGWESAFGKKKQIPIQRIPIKRNAQLQKEIKK